MTHAPTIHAGELHRIPMEIRERARQAAEYLEGWRRARADYENLHRRAGEERQAARQEGARAAFLALLAAVDHLDAAVRAVPGDLASHPWVEGVRHISRAFAQALVAEGIEPIVEERVPLDPARHEAVATVQDAAAEGTVIAVVARGYRMGGTVLRPAKVTVSAGPAQESVRLAAVPRTELRSGAGAVPVRGEGAKPGKRASRHVAGEPSTSETLKDRKEV